MQRIFSGIYWHPTLLRALVAILCFAGAVWLDLAYLNPAPPSIVTIATGPKGGAYEFFAQQYREKLARARVTLNIRITDGTSENIRLLEDPKSGVQVAFVVGGASNSQQAPGLLSLGRVNDQVFWLFYRGTETLDDLTQLKGKRIGVGSEGVVTQRVLAAAGVNSESATLVPLTGSAAIEALNDGRLDAIFIALAPDSSTLQTLLHDPDVRLMSVSQAGALARIFPYLVRLVLPQGVIDLEHNIPSKDVNLIGTTNAVVVREDLHPEIIDLLAKTLVEVHGGAGIFQRAGEFPTQTDPEFAVADGALEFYKNGSSFRDRMRALYHRLRNVETSMQTDLTVAQLDALQSDLETIDRSANDLGVPIRHSDLFFDLKIHINHVRQRLGLRRAAVHSEICKVS